MKTWLKMAVMASLLTLVSCAHHGKGGCGSDKQCDMKKDSKECKECCEKGQCDTKKEEAPKA